MTNAKVKADAKRLAAYNPTAARRMLTQNGFRYDGNRLVDPRGNRVSFTIHVISGWSDWVASLQIITRNLQDIGIDARVKLEPDWGSLVPERDEHEVRDPALADRRGGLAVRLLLQQHAREHVPPLGAGRRQHGQLRAFKDSRATSLLNRWKATPP